ncbi:MAG: 50S ribosomal protein L7/L12 [uncultured bacterium]|nr:MAG: 50S ribosomal protein L7/L12 [uncultured bacterium]KKT75683.1 MAG: 50S ribosomal protein L7/L12 [Candidatus Peregrinibacteria bacterium GW2011_GWA2_44_7]
MSSEHSKISRLRELVENAELSLKSAKIILSELLGEDSEQNSHRLHNLASQLDAKMESGQQIIEGIFDGQNMIGPNGKVYPVPSNYASKSKLIPGDQLKLTVAPNGAFIYKQIGPIERKRLMGHVAFEDGQYKILAEGKSYNVLLASVTYFKADIGDEVTLVVPSESESDWGAIENVLPKLVE